MGFEGLNPSYGLRANPPYDAVNAGKKYFTFLIHVPETSLILFASCPMRGAF
jgi:hypothetical protein